MHFDDKQQDISRRSFLRQTAVSTLAAGSLLGGVASGLADTRRQSIKKYGGFRMGIQSYSLRAFRIKGALDKIHALELHWIEFFRGHYPVTPDKKKIAEMKAMLDKRDMSISAHGVQSFGKDEKANRNMFQSAQNPIRLSHLPTASSVCLALS